MDESFAGFEPRGSFSGKPFQQRLGPAHARGEKACQIKICLVATDLDYLVELMRTLSEREDCYAVKFSEGHRDGMHLGRCFLTDPANVGVLVKQLKGDEKLMVSCQDDTFFKAFRKT